MAGHASPDQPATSAAENPDGKAALYSGARLLMVNFGVDKIRIRVVLAAHSVAHIQALNTRMIPWHDP